MSKNIPKNSIRPTDFIPAVDKKREKIFTFPQGIPGFEEYTTFRKFHKDDDAVSAYWLESCDSPEVTFTLVDPTEYDLNYDLYLSDIKIREVPLIPYILSLVSQRLIKQ